MIAQEGDEGFWMPPEDEEEVSAPTQGNAVKVRDRPINAMVFFGPAIWCVNSPRVTFLRCCYVVVYHSFLRPPPHLPVPRTDFAGT